MLDQIHEYVNVGSYRRMSLEMYRVYWEFICGLAKLPNEANDVAWDKVANALHNVVLDIWGHTEELEYEWKYTFITMLRFYRFHMMGTQFDTEETHQRLVELIKRNAKGSLKRLMLEYLDDLEKFKQENPNE